MCVHSNVFMCVCIACMPVCVRACECVRASAHVRACRCECSASVRARLHSCVRAGVSAEVGVVVGVGVVAAKTNEVWKGRPRDFWRVPNPPC